jgi:hypothetical protein
MNELLNASVNARGLRDFFVAYQMFTLIRAVTMVGRMPPFGNPGVTRSRTAAVDGGPR